MNNMSREEMIRALLETQDEAEQTGQLNRIEAKLDVLLSVIVVQQKDAAHLAGITVNTIRNKVLRGETEILCGSRYAKR